MISKERLEEIAAGPYNALILKAAAKADKAANKKERNRIKLRNRFATAAMQALISSRHESFTQWGTFADYAFHLADEMMKESNK
jgi:hypothetical protein